MRWLPEAEVTPARTARGSVLAVPCPPAVAGQQILLEWKSGTYDL